MAGILVIGEVGPDGSLSRLSAEVGTLGRELGAAGAGDVVASLASGSDAAGQELAAVTGGRVLVAGSSDDLAATAMVGAAEALAGDATWILVPASPDGRDAAGALSARLGLPVLANATAVRWSDEGPVVTTSAFGGKLVIEAASTTGRAIITVRPNALTASPAATPGSVETAAGAATSPLPAVTVTGHEDAGSAAAQIDDARIIVAGGRGVGGPDGFALLQDLADELGGAVGATRAAVDSGWIAYSQQIGQTGKIVKPQLYLALGISGAIQHKVGMQTAETIVAVNRDPDAPLADFADVYVVGDLFEVGRALLDQLRARTG